MESTEVTVDFCYKEKYEQAFSKSVRLGGLDREIQLLKDIIMSSPSARPCASVEVGLVMIFVVNTFSHISSEEN